MDEFSVPEKMVWHRHEQQGANSRMLCSELKQLYTAITRARRKVWVYDEDNKKRDQIAAYFRREDLIEVIKNPSDSLEVVSSKFAEPSPSFKWELRGQEFEDENRWELAAKCYERAGVAASDRVKYCKAQSAVVRWQNSRNREEHHKALVEAAHTFKCQGMQELAAKVYRFAGKYVKAAEIFDGIGKVGTRLEELHLRERLYRHLMHCTRRHAFRRCMFIEGLGSTKRNYA